MVFNLLCHLSWQAGMLKLTKMLNFKCFYTFGSFSPSFWAGHKGAHVKIAQNHKSVTFSWVSYFPLWSRSIGGSAQTLEKCSISNIFSSGSFSQKFWAGHGVAYIKIAWNYKNMTCNCIPNGFYFTLWSRSSGSSAKTYERWYFLRACGRLGLIPQVFGWIKKWHILGLHEMIRVLHAVACQIVFISFMIEVGRKECSKLWRIITF